MRTYSIYLILFLAGILASCEDFLDQSPKIQSDPGKCSDGL